MEIFLNFFLAIDFCRFCVVIRVFHPRQNGQWPPTSKDFLFQILSITFFSYLNSWERASIFPFKCSVLNKGTTGTIFITSLVWRGPWLGIEPGTSCTRSQHYTTRLSRRLCDSLSKCWELCDSLSNVETMWFIIKIIIAKSFSVWL